MADPNYRAMVLRRDRWRACPDVTDLTALVLLSDEACCAMHERRGVTVQFDLQWDRPKGWPLPIVKAAPGEPQVYRPLAILDFVEYQLTLAERRERAVDLPCTRGPVFDTNVDDLV